MSYSYDSMVDLWQGHYHTQAPSGYITTAMQLLYYNFKAFLANVNRNPSNKSRKRS